MGNTRSHRIATRLGAVLAAAMVLAALAAARAEAADADKNYVMKLGVATLNDTQHEWMKLFVAAVEQDSGGRIKGEIYPASQLGSIPREIEGVQFGSIQGYIGPPEFFVGVDERYEVLSAPGLVAGVDQAIRVAADPQLKSMIFGFGTNKGIHAVAIFIAQPSSVIARSPINHLADFKGKKLRVLAAHFQEETIKRLGGTPIAMTLADVLPALQGGTIDGAVAIVSVFTQQGYIDVAKSVTETGQPYIFSLATISRKWYEGLPPDLQKVIDADAEKAVQQVTPWARDFYTAQRKVWLDKGGSLIQLPPDEQAEMMKMIATVGDDLSKDKPALKEAYDAVVAAAKRAQ